MSDNSLNKSLKQSIDSKKKGHTPTTRYALKFTKQTTLQ